MLNIFGDKKKNVLDTYLVNETLPGQAVKAVFIILAYIFNCSQKQSDTFEHTSVKFLQSTEENGEENVHNSNKTGQHIYCGTNVLW